MSGEKAASQQATSHGQVARGGISQTEIANFDLREESADDNEIGQVVAGGGSVCSHIFTKPSQF